jgi:dihydrofolate synthase/folylpolyglutamate synthase
MDYQKIKDRISSHINNKEIRDISRVKKMLKEFGCPEGKLKVIHVAGTNGKGSVCASLSSILNCASYKVGLFTSPHLVKINERIKINNIDISDEKLEEILTKAEDASKKINIDLTFFEILTVAAIIYFYEEKCDLCIFEAGMGGEFDATNIFEKVQVSAIINIGFDHMEVLGNTIEEITRAKAGIIKKSTPVVIYDYENKNIEKIIEDKALSQNANIIKTDFTAIKNNQDDSFDYKNYKNIKLKLNGNHQIFNACMVLEIINILQDLNYTITDENIKKGFQTVHWPGRYQIISEKPYIVIDGAHNELCFDVILPQIKSDIKSKNIKSLEFILAFLKDKDVSNIIKKINTLSSAGCELKYLITTVDNERAYSTRELEDIIKAFSNNYEIIEDPYSYIMSKVDSNEENKMIIVSGSLYLMGEILKNKI